MKRQNWYSEQIILFNKLWEKKITGKSHIFILTKINTLFNKKKDPSAHFMKPTNMKKGGK